MFSLTLVALMMCSRARAHHRGGGSWEFFSFSFTPIEEGSWTVRVSWDGSWEGDYLFPYNGATSQIESFTVVKNEFATASEYQIEESIDIVSTIESNTTSENKELRDSSIPGFQYESIFIGIVASIIILLVIQKRQ